MPSPQSGMRPQSAPHVPGAGGSQSSPHGEFTIPSPQRSPASSAQDAEQPSQSSTLPSSQASAPHTTPSPQPVTSVQSFEQPSQRSVLPSSHSSDGSTRPFPHDASRGGSSILTNRPRPRVPATAGSFEVHV